MAELDINNLTLNDINIDSITNNDKTGVFDRLMESVNDNINTQYTEGRITSGDYANVYLGSLQAVLQQSIQFVLQEQLSEAQISGILKDNYLKDAEIAKTYNMQAAELEKSWGYAVTRDTDGSIILGDSTGLGKIDKDISVSERTTVIAEAQHTDTLLTTVKQRVLLDEEVETAGLQQILLTTEEEIKTAQNIDIIAKTTIAIDESAKNVLLMQEQIESEALNNKIEGMIESQILKIKEDIEVSKEQVKIAKTQTATEQANSIANIDKVLGYSYTLDTENNIVIDIDTQDGKLDYEKELIREQTESEALNNKVDGIIDNQIISIKKDVDVKERTTLDTEATGTSQRKAIYTDTLAKDKQAAKLGLDNVMKLSEAARDADANFKYSPNYTDPGA